MRSPKVSVIVPLYNPRKDWLMHCLDSVKSQTYNNIELIIVDDSPKANNKEIIEETAKMDYRFINNKKNKGIPQTRNAGIEDSEGKFITILDQDDIMKPKKVERQVKCFQDNSNVGMVLTDIDHIDQEDNLIKNRGFGVELQEMNSRELATFFFRNYKRKTSCPLTTEMVKSNIYKEVGLYDENLFGVNDRDMLLRINKKYKIYFIRESLLKKRYHANNASGTGQKLLEDNKKLTKKLIKLYPHLRDYKSEREAFWNLRSGGYNLKRGKPLKGIQYILKAIIQSPEVSKKKIIKFIKTKIFKRKI